MISVLNGARWLAVFAAAALTIGGCGGSSGGGGGAGGGSLAKNYHLSGAHFNVGAKEFTEQQILGYITTNALKAAGASVNYQSLTGSNTVRTALTSGRIDMYWEYDGTAWLSYLNNTMPIKDPQEQFQTVGRTDLTQNHIKWLSPAKFSDTYAVAVRQNAPGAMGQVKNLSQLASYVKAHPADSTFCGASEFLNRSDGLPGLQKTYGFTFSPGNIKTVDLAIDYTSVAKGNPCNFAEVFTTDGRIQTLHLKVLEDDKATFASYVPALNVREQVYTPNSKQLNGISADLANKLTTDTMQQLNKQVDVDGMTAEDVAKGWLSKNGFV